jgi:hypothetical protein
VVVVVVFRELGIASLKTMMVATSKTMIVLLLVLVAFLAL